LKNYFQGDVEDKWEGAFGNNVDVVGCKGVAITGTESFNGRGMCGKQIYTLRGYMRKTLRGE
jgi:hypothetical protein